MQVEYKFDVDYAKSNRSKCNKCKVEINQNSLRIAILVQAPNFDGKIPRWFHYDCFWKSKAHVESTAEIKNFDSIRWEDQEKIRAAINSEIGSLKPPKPGKSPVSYQMERHTVLGSGKKPTFMCHLSCFLKSNECPEDISQLVGFNKLSTVDQDAVVLAFREKSKENRKRPGQQTEQDSKLKKAKLNGDVEQDELRKQNKLLWSLRDKLESQVSKEALIGLLEYNEQHVPSGLSRLLDAVADAMIFGALSYCPSCKNGPLHYSNGQFKCSAMATEWVQCLYHTRTPDRRKFKIPKEYQDVDFLKNYKYVKRTRLFPPDSVSDITGPLTGLFFYITNGPFDSGKTKEQLIREFANLGGAIMSKLSVNSIVVSTLNELEQIQSDNNDKSKTYSKEALTTARSYGLRVINEQFLSEFSPSKLDSKKLESKIQQLYPIGRLRARAIKVEKEVNNLPLNDDNGDQEMMRMIMKNGAVVDPQSELVNKATVLKDEKGEFMTAVLGMVDLIKGSNSFYKLQALQSDKSPRCWVFRAWGRIGTSIGGTKTESFPNANSARSTFKEIYFEKTGNEWESRKNFRKVPHKFYELELDYNSSKTNEIQTISNIPCKLHPALQSLLKFICDVKSMEKTMAEFELDLRKMPLGKLSSNQIHEAYDVLNSLSQLITSRPTKQQSQSLDRTQILSESTRFYTLIPHDFGFKTPPMLDNKKIITKKIHMLEDLLEIELAYKMLQTKGDSKCNPLDEHYEQLHTKLEPLDSNCEDYKLILDYVRETHGATHTQYTLEVLNIFEVHRDGEDSRFAKCKIAQHNKQLLWHGSRQTNWMGILSQGLRIAPPDAPVTGYMFGKGIYFADIVSKSANYCFTTQSQPEGLLLLCEVILGDMNECLQADASDLPPKYHSRKGIGSVTPDPSTFHTNKDGVVYPIGKPIDSNVPNTTLCYNEYIVYNVSQVKQKYLVRVKFHYK
ncbi:poly [ADP-ribose] polymerase, putative [Schistosoma mansoni]|uniref:poly [ADP-ribose] polymerase, putative n=1 Tax=Schistosoma mansoni TaxID=6183 RepID=UPI00022C8669|nr:poly [ADP-ribose] polymerase, putative [Schistosoma mansoni]|eukprot:XP_018647027.1 poly [ADP-ribose] polymerase, putative [Schistosoma mansoni]